MSNVKVFFLIILLMICFISTCKAQIDLGIGIVSIDFNEKTTIRLYKQPYAKQPAKLIEFFNDKSINSWSIKDLKTKKHWLKPEVLWLDYYSLDFRCKSKINGWYEIVVNNETGKTFWLKNENFTEFLTWEMFLKSKFVVERSPNHKQAIRKLPSNNSTKIKYVGEDCFQVKSMKGDWIQIFTSEFCKSGYGENEKTVIQSGWLRWKTGNELLINYLLAD